jgi:hypothetical protein
MDQQAKIAASLTVLNRQVAASKGALSSLAGVQMAGKLDQTCGSMRELLKNNKAVIDALDESKKALLQGRKDASLVVAISYEKAAQIGALWPDALGPLQRDALDQQLVKLHLSTMLDLHRIKSETELKLTDAAEKIERSHSQTEMPTLWEMLKPTAAVFGVSYRGIGPLNGQFALVNGENTTYFASRILEAHDVGPGKLGQALVGTLNMSKGSLEAGYGRSYKFPIYKGGPDVLLFVNGRAEVVNYKTGASILDAAHGDYTVSVNAGVCLSASDLALMATKRLAGPGGALAATAVENVNNSTYGADGWVGAAWRVAINFKDNNPDTVTIAGKTIPFQDFIQGAREAVFDQTQSKP